MQALGLLEPIKLHPCSSALDAPPDPRFVRSNDLVSRAVAGETVVVPICRGVADLEAIFTLNGVGTRLWALLAEGRTESELSAFVAQRFAVLAEQAQCDVRNFLAELQAAGLVRTV